MVKKVTYTLDDATVRRVDSASERLKMPKSQVIRDAVAEFDEGLGRLSERERLRQLRVLRDLVPLIPKRPRAEVEQEIAEIRSARRTGGRGGTPRGSR
ncbi:MAG TPA: ribbon-helix-helix protein, CopG family [Thermoanaerobaculia bacterium]|jgi:hypothetical protein|nr:ribbon-helix-helix protein, CopG family [Thermoanaerobaculia bacterium]